MGAINLKHNGSGSDITLSSDGTDLLLDGTAIGGGGGAALELYAENPSSPTAPSATGSNAVAIGNGASSTSQDSFAIGRDTTASNFYTVALGYQAVASGSQALAGPRSTASGSQSVCLGTLSTASGGTTSVLGQQASATVTDGLALGRYATSAGAAAAALGKSYASGTDSFAAVIDNNTSSYGATGTYSVAIGRSNKATAVYSAAIGGYLGVSTANYSTTLGGRENVSDASYSVASGYGASVNGIIGKVVHSSVSSGTAGDFQTGKLVMVGVTADATAKVLTSTSTAASTTNQIILPNNSAYAFHGTIVARQQASGGTASAAWKIEGLIRREGSAGTTVLVNSATTVLDNTPGWGLALSADTTNGGLKIEATGAASTNIRWVATIHTSEVTYA